MSRKQACGYNGDKTAACSLQKERAGEKQEGGQKLNHAKAQSAAAIHRALVLLLLLLLLLLQKALGVDHVLFHAAPGLHLVDQGGVADLPDAHRVVILVGFAAALVVQKVGAIHAAIHELLVRLGSWGGLVDVITAVVSFVGGLGAIAAVHVVVVVLFLRGVVEVKMWLRETSQSVAKGHSSYSTRAGCYHGLFGKAWRFRLVSHGLY